MANNSIIQEIKDRLDVVTVVGRYVPLKKSGNSYKGLCPFHSEKTPSFHVFPHTGTWKCFGCGAGGDIFTFVEKRENLPFPDVLRMLAKEAGVRLEEPRPEVRDALQRLRDIHAQATFYFQSQLLTSDAGKRAREYLVRREVDQETIEKFQLGYAPDGWEQLIGHLRGKGYALEEIIKAGLAVQRESGGAYDRFRNRLIIPIRDAQGRVIAFGGRILGEGEPKYLNSPQTPIFDKSQVIFALDLAKRAIRSKDQAVLVEGYMDVISAHQRGFKNVVAAMGTSITPEQIKILSRYSRNFIFALDADAAGARAAWRGIQIAQEELSRRGVLTPTSRGFRTENRMLADVGIAVMPEGKDPDDVLREEPALWRALIENAIPVVDYTLQQMSLQFDLHTASGKSQFVQQILPTLSKIGDPIQRRHYIGKVAGMVRVREQDIEEALRLFERNQRRRSSRRRQSPSTALPANVPPAPPPGVESNSTGSDLPPKNAVVGSDEEPPLWIGGNSVLADDSKSSPKSDLKHAKAPAIGAEEHLLGLILYHHHALLPWLDEELAARQIDPIYSDDFNHPLNRAVFEALDEFRFDAPENDLLDFMAQQDPHVQDHFLFLWEYASQFESEKPKHIQFHHLQREVVTGLIRLRLKHARETQRQLEFSLGESLEPEELNMLSARFQHLLAERRKLEQAMLVYSQAARWANNNRPTYISAR